MVTNFFFLLYVEWLKRANHATPWVHVKRHIPSNPPLFSSRAAQRSKFDYSSKWTAIVRCLNYHLYLAVTLEICRGTEPTNSRWKRLILIETNHVTYQLRVCCTLSTDHFLSSHFIPWKVCPVGWDCRIHRLLLCRGVRHQPMSHVEVPVILDFWEMRSTLLDNLLGFVNVY